MSDRTSPIRVDSLSFGTTHIDGVIERAIKYALDIDRLVIFEFNGVEVTVSGNSSHGLIYRDWSRAISGYIPDNKVEGLIRFIL